MSRRVVADTVQVESARSSGNVLGTGHGLYQGSSIPERITTDGHNAYSGAIKAELGEAVRHQTNRYLNNHLEQDHRSSKKRTPPMGGFKNFASAKRFCRVHDEARNFLRSRSRRNESVSLVQGRLLYAARTRVLLTSLAAA
jgi:putative transposase